MHHIIAAITGAIGAAATLFFLVAITTIFGTISGFIVGIVFQGPILHVLASLGVNIVDLHLWQIGATLGFIGPFFRGSVTNKIVK